MDLKKVLIEFLLTFIILYIIYYFFIIKKCKKKKDYVPVEVNLILVLYKIDYKKIDIYKMVIITSLVSTIIMALIITLISNFFDSTIIVLIFGTLVSVVIAFICYNIIGSHFKKKSLEKHSRTK